MYIWLSVRHYAELCDDMYISWLSVCQTVKRCIYGCPFVKLYRLVMICIFGCPFVKLYIKCINYMIVRLSYCTEHSFPETLLLPFVYLINDVVYGLSVCHVMVFRCDLLWGITAQLDVGASLSPELLGVKRKLHLGRVDPGVQRGYRVVPYLKGRSLVSLIKNLLQSFSFLDAFIPRLK